MATDPTLRRTYQIEVELDTVRLMRTTAAHRLHRAALMFDAAERANRHGLSMFFLRRELRRALNDYDCACRVVHAAEHHHMDSYLLGDVQDFMAEAEKERRARTRDLQDDAVVPEEMLRAIMTELRAIRDKIDPPRPVGFDSMNARRAMNELRDEPIGGAHAQGT